MPFQASRWKSSLKTSTSRTEGGRNGRWQMSPMRWCRWRRTTTSAMLEALFWSIAVGAPSYFPCFSSSCSDCPFCSVEQIRKMAWGAGNYGYDVRSCKHRPFCKCKLLCRTPLSLKTFFSFCTHTCPTFIRVFPVAHVPTMTLRTRSCLAVKGTTAFLGTYHPGNKRNHIGIARWTGNEPRVHNAPRRSFTYRLNTKNLKNRSRVEAR